MKSDFLEFIGNARHRRNEKFRVQLWVFLICLILSIFIWSLVRLSKEYYYSIDYHLTYKNPPSNLKMTACSDSVITLKLKIQGFDFFSEQFLLEQDHQFEVSLKNVHLHFKGETASGYILTHRIGREIVSLSSFPTDVFYVTPDTIFFDFDRSGIKKMPSKPTPGSIELNTDHDSVILKKVGMIQRKNQKKQTTANL